MLIPQSPAPAAQVPVPAPAEAPKPNAAPVADPAAPASPPEIGKDPEPRADKFSARFAALTRQEKALRAEQAKWKAEREAEQKEWAPKVEQAKKYEELKTKGKTDKAIALEALQELGLSYDDLTKMFLNDSKPTPEMIARAAQEQVEALRREQIEEREKLSKTQKDSQAAAEQAAIDDFKAQIRDTMSVKPDEFELTLTHANGVQLVYDVIEEHYKATGRVLPAEEATALVEKHLEAELEESAKNGKLPKKLQKLLGAKAGEGENPAPAGSQGDGAAPKAPQPVAPRTLTNSSATAAPTPTRAQVKSLEESKAEAAKILKWT
jgi:uncharacterized protein